MKPVKIELKNAEKLEQLLKAHNGTATTHVLTSFAELLSVAERFKSKLEKLGLNKKQSVNARCIYLSGGAVAKAYKRARKVTELTLQVKTSGVFLTALKSDLVYPSICGGFDYLLTLDQHTAVINNFLKINNVVRTAFPS